MTKHISQSIIWDDRWQMIQVKQHEFSRTWVFFAMVKKNWYYGEGEDIATAIAECDLKIEFNQRLNVKPETKLEELKELF